MRGDLNDQFQRAQSATSDDNTSEKVIIGVSIFVAVCFIAMIVGITIFVVKTLDKFIETEPSTNISRELVTQINDLNNQIFNGGSTSGDTGSVTAASDGFEYGTIEGTTYYSRFSGITFAAPNDWILTSYASNNPSRSPKDMSASGNGMNCSVTIQYENMKTNNYRSAEAALDSTQKMIDSYGYTVLEKNASVKWGGNKFTGIIFKDTFSNYKEVLVAEVNGYILKISLSASSDTNLSICRSYFN